MSLEAEFQRMSDKIANSETLINELRAVIVEQAEQIRLLEVERSKLTDIIIRKS
jgi:uncharacterized coiled-coil protein SlyX